jgi:hypothetical protein
MDIAMTGPMDGLHGTSMYNKEYRYQETPRNMQVFDYDHGSVHAETPVCRRDTRLPKTDAQTGTSIPDRRTIRDKSETVPTVLDAPARKIEERREPSGPAAAPGHCKDKDIQHYAVVSPQHSGEIQVCP